MARSVSHTRKASSDWNHMWLICKLWSEYRRGSVLCEGMLCTKTNVFLTWRKKLSQCLLWCVWHCFSPAGNSSLFMMVRGCLIKHKEERHKRRQSHRHRGAVTSRHCHAGLGHTWICIPSNNVDFLLIVPVHDNQEQSSTRIRKFTLSQLINIQKNNTKSHIRWQIRLPNNMHTQPLCVCVTSFRVFSAVPWSLQYEVLYVCDSAITGDDDAPSKRRSNRNTHRPHGSNTHSPPHQMTRHVFPSDFRLQLF